MIIVYIILLFIAVLLFMLLLGFIDIVYNKFGGKILRSYECDCWRDMCCCLRHWYSCLNLVLTVCNWHAYYWINLNGSIILVKVRLQR